jgi:hypothetical protein
MTPFRLTAWHSQKAQRDARIQVGVKRDFRTVSTK